GDTNLCGAQNLELGSVATGTTFPVGACIESRAKCRSTLKLESGRGWKTADQEGRGRRRSKIMENPKKLPREGLRTRLAVKDGDTLRILATGHDPRTTGWHPGESAIEQRMQCGDELWMWWSPEWTWAQLVGRAGLAIVRNGDPVDFEITIIS